MHILLIHNNYSKFSGEENALRAMVNVLESKGNKVTQFRKSSEGVENSFFKKVHAFFSGIYSFSSRRSVEKILDEEDIDLVQVQNLYPFISASVLLACKARNIPVVMRCPNYRLFCPNGLHLTKGKVCERCLGGKEWNCIIQNCEGNLFKSIGYAARNAFARKTRMIFDNVTVFLVLSEFQKKRFIAGGIPEEKIAFLPNIAQRINGDDEMHEGHLVSFTGRVSPEKGIHEFLEAAGNLPDISFSVAGATNAMPGIETDAPDNVHFSGFLEGDAYADFYKQSKILVFPSLWFEGFPNVIAQAMAYGKPIIASRIGAIPEIVDDGVTGLLFEPGNADELTEKIRVLNDNPEMCLKMGKAGMRKAMNEYSAARYYEYLSSAYEKAIKLNAEISAH